MSVSPDYFSKFDNVLKKYLESRGEGNTKASQIVTAVNKILYKWYNDGDVFDNEYAYEWAEHCCNDLSSYANWLYRNTDLCDILDDIYACNSEDDYEELLKRLADTALVDEYLAPLSKEATVGTIYDCKGGFKYVIHYDDEEDEEYYAYDEEEAEEEYEEDED
jgi:hypothetical protein